MAETILFNKDGYKTKVIKIMQLNKIVLVMLIFLISSSGLMNLSK